MGEHMIKGYYENNKDEEDIVRAIYFPSFEDEVIIEAFTGVMKYWKVKDFLKRYTKTDKEFKVKLDRVRDGLGTGKYEQHNDNMNHNRKNK